MIHSAPAGVVAKEASIEQFCAFLKLCTGEGIITETTRRPLSFLVFHARIFQ